MAGKIDARLRDLKIKLPTPSAPVANYMPYVVAGNLVFVSGQIPMGFNGIEFDGKVGADMSVEDGKKAARLCGLNLIAQLREACSGNLDRVTRVVKLGGFVNCTETFSQQPQVINGASDLMVEIFGDAGRHSRSAVGVSNLPMNVAVEVDGIFEIRD
ncbi:MAG TPA: RidA family protein [Alphaproteobacteria bacterium]|nr:RidA family protein [Alphaproteobacteria bacterium]